jgi:hypothetical protein
LKKGGGGALHIKKMGRKTQTARKETTLKKSIQDEKPKTLTMDQVLKLCQEEKQKRSLKKQDEETCLQEWHRLRQNLIEKIASQSYEAFTQLFEKELKRYISITASYTSFYFVLSKFYYENKFMDHRHGFTEDISTACPSLETHEIKKMWEPIFKSLNEDDKYDGYDWAREDFFAKDYTVYGICLALCKMWNDSHEKDLHLRLIGNVMSSTITLRFE